MALTCWKEELCRAERLALTRTAGTGATIVVKKKKNASRKRRIPRQSFSDPKFECIRDLELSRTHPLRCRWNRLAFSEEASQEKSRSPEKGRSGKFFESFCVCANRNFDGARSTHARWQAKRFMFLITTNVISRFMNTELATPQCLTCLFQRP